ncbi:MAG: glucuronate isomerase [Clostridia bacterium]|nr:glucuronate isomerase [Clostridia bacterium]
MPHAPRNPADLLHLGSDPALCRLLRACGTDEACITGGASDYDRFLALSVAMPLCAGHPLRDKVNAVLTQATGLSIPLCPHTVHLHWNAWVETYLYGRQVTATDVPTVCPFCAEPTPVLWRRKDLFQLPNPTEVKAPDLNTWSRELENALPTDQIPAVFTLPETYSFIRPDPYHANLAVGKAASGEELTAKEQDLLITQALRVWGLSLVRKDHHTAPCLLLCGAAPEAVTALLAYLNRTNALTDTVWLPDDSAHAEAVNGLYPQVGTGYILAEETSAEAAGKKKTAYAKAAPIGRATLLLQ